MASKYWVGGTNTWNGTAGTKWSTTSGGAGGAAIPGASDDVFFDGNSGANTVTISGGSPQCLNLNFTGFTGTLAGSTDCQVGTDGTGASLTLVAGMTMTYTGAFIMLSTGNLTTNGLSCTCGFTMNGAGKTWTLQDNLTTTGTLTVTRATFNANNKNLTLFGFQSSNTNGRTITMGSGTWTISDTWNISDTTNLTFNSDTSTLKFSNISVGGASVSPGQNITYYNFWNDATGNTNGLQINNGATNTTFNDFKCSANTKALIQSGSTMIAITFTLIGTAGNLITLTNSGGATHFTFSQAAGTVAADYISIDHSTATGGATFNASHSTDGGNNTGWNFIVATSNPAFLLNLI